MSRGRRIDRAEDTERVPEWKKWVLVVALVGGGIARRPLTRQLDALAQAAS
jgi:hypothetical protein